MVVLPITCSGSRTIERARHCHLLALHGPGTLTSRQSLNEGLSGLSSALAPERGAIRAAFDAAWECEAALASDETAATILADLRKFYEYIEFEDFAAGAAREGVPRAIILLAAHMYMGSWRMVVGKTMSNEVSLYVPWWQDARGRQFLYAAT